MSCGDIWRSFEDGMLFLSGVVHHDKKTAGGCEMDLYKEFGKYILTNKRRFSPKRCIFPFLVNITLRKLPPDTNVTRFYTKSFLGIWKWTTLMQVSISIELLQCKKLIPRSKVFAICFYVYLCAWSTSDRVNFILSC